MPQISEIDFNALACLVYSILRTNGQHNKLHHRP